MSNKCLDGSALLSVHPVVHKQSTLCSLTFWIHYIECLGFFSPLPHQTPKKVGAMWTEARLNWSDFLPEDEDVNKFVSHQVCTEAVHDVIFVLNILTLKIKRFNCSKISTQMPEPTFSPYALHL